MTTAQFKKTILAYYHLHRRDLPWRTTRNPYRILVSEIMLQQTQVPRVLIKYKEWLKQFPTFEDLATASLSEVLKAWQGLGYNRRALNLQRTAKKVVEKYNGKFPKKYEEILDLPGIGPYTAGAIMAFAYNKPVPIIETNIRTVFIHFFFKDMGGIHDKEIMPFVEKALDKQNPREWYYALMDYGVMLKATTENPSRRSLHHVRQSSFIGSNRQIRSTILKAITTKPLMLGNLSEELKRYSLSPKIDLIHKNVEALITEGFIENNNGKLTISGQ